jgi:hypothetical protein
MGGAISLIEADSTIVVLFKFKVKSLDIFRQHESKGRDTAEHFFPSNELVICKMGGDAGRKWNRIFAVAKAEPRWESRPAGCRYPTLRRGPVPRSSFPDKSQLTDSVQLEREKINLISRSGAKFRVQYSG